MKLKVKKNKILFTLTICILLAITGCNKNDLSENSEKDILNTIVNEDAIVNLDKDGNVLNYNDETESSLEESVSEENKDSIETETTIKESISTEEETSIEEETELEEPTSIEIFEPGSKKDLNCIIYLPDNKMQVHTTENFMAETIESVPNRIIEELIKKNILNDKIKINNISFKKPDKCIIDFSKEYLEQIQNAGSTEEYFIVSCVVNSFIDTYDNIKYVMITVDGKGFETGHCEYYNYIPKY